MEHRINPLGLGTHLNKDLVEILKMAQILKMIDDSRHRYCLMPSATCIEGDWDEVMALFKLCHEQARSLSSHVMTTIQIEDEAGATDKLNENIIKSFQHQREPNTQMVFAATVKSSTICEERK